MKSNFKSKFNLKLIIIRRNVLEESARIARGNVKDIRELKTENFDVNIIQIYVNLLIFFFLFYKKTILILFKFEVLILFKFEE